MLAQQGIPPCIPPRCYRKKPVHYSKRVYRKRQEIENLFVPTEGLAAAAHFNPLRPLRPHLPFCHPPLLVMRPDPRDRADIGTVHIPNLS